MKANTKVIEEKYGPSADKGKIGTYKGLFVARGRVYLVSISRNGGKQCRGNSWMLDTYSGVNVWVRQEYEPEEEQEAINSIKGEVDRYLNVEKEVQFYKDMLNKIGMD